MQVVMLLLRFVFLLLILLCTRCRSVSLVYDCVLLLSDFGPASVLCSFSNDR